MIPAVAMTFAAVFLSIMAVFYAMTAARQSPAAGLKRRLQQLSEADEVRRPTSSAIEITRGISPAEQFLFNLPFLNRLKRLLVQAGLQMNSTTFLMIMILAPITGFAVVLMMKHSLPFAVVAAVLVEGVLFLYLNHRRRQRLQKFTEQLPDALIMIGRSLRAGHSLTGAVELIGQELADPAGGLFRTVYEQQKLGVRINEALTMMLDKMESLDLRFFVTIVNINNEVGGNLAEILEKLADTIRARLQIRRQVSVYTAQGRLSGYILAVLPVVTFAGLYVLLPGYLDVFFKDPRAKIILAGAVSAEVVGFFVIRRIIDIRI